MNFKQKVYEHYQEILEEKISLLRKTLQELVHSTQNETKSSAGDKYETGRAMLQIEQDNVRKQLTEALEQKAAFEKINIKNATSEIRSGSLVRTDKGYLLISIAMGKILVGDELVIALSPQSPLGNKLLGLRKNESVTMMGTKYTVENVE